MDQASPNGPLQSKIQSLNLGYCPQHFRESTTVVLRKQGKDNYTVPGSYRPIGLLNTIGKVMDAIMANHLSYVAETYSLLPSTHIGGRKLSPPSMQYTTSSTRSMKNGTEAKDR